MHRTLQKKTYLITAILLILSLVVLTGAITIMSLRLINIIN